MIRSTNYLSLDLELNTVDGNTTHLIEVGAAVGNVVDGIFFKKQWYIKPTFDLKGQLICDYTLSDHIIGLTGITQEDYDQNAVDSQIVAAELGDIINGSSCFVNPVTWGIGDTDELKNTFKHEGIQFPFFGRRFIDVKTLYLYIEAANGRSLSGGLRKSMNRYGIKFIGEPHRAATDAENTLRFFFHLLDRQKKLEDTIKLFKQI